MAEFTPVAKENLIGFIKFCIDVDGIGVEETVLIRVKQNSLI